MSLPVNVYIQWLIPGDVTRHTRPLNVSVHRSLDDRLRTEHDFRAVVWKQVSSKVESRKNQEIKPHYRSSWPQQGRTRQEERRQGPGSGTVSVCHGGKWNCGCDYGYHLHVDSLEEPLNNLSNPVSRKRFPPCRETQDWQVVWGKQSKEPKGLTFIKRSQSPKVCSRGRNGQCLSPSDAKSVRFSLNNLDHLVTNEMLKRKNVQEYVSWYWSPTQHC